MTTVPARFFHLHLVSDSTGETLSTVARAVAARYPKSRAIEHTYVMVRDVAQIERITTVVEHAPGIVLFTIVDTELAERLISRCRSMGVPAFSVLDPVVAVFESYLGDAATKIIGAQHVLDQQYFQRIEALNFTLAHDDGALPDSIDDAQIIIVGVSRTSKTPTSIYLAHRGYRTANYPLVPGIAVSQQLLRPSRALIVGLVASTERIIQVRRNRLLNDGIDGKNEAYVDRTEVAQEIAQSRKLCAAHGWPIIDVTRRSIEETAAAILALYLEHEDRAQSASNAGDP
ncbi:MAG: pyruvate, water dikinase regulatory protein [Pseudomonadota bacterium]